MFRKILIANRGVAAVRIAKTCRRLRVKVATLFTAADKRSIHLDPSYSDERFEIDDYLNLESIIRVAKKARVDAIHPGYGFRAEDYEFSKICEENKFPFAGPSGRVMERIGNKLYARRKMREAGLRIIPGTVDAVEDIDDASVEAQDLGYPVLLKPVYGGGGKGMHAAHNEDELRDVFDMAQSEAVAAFARPELYLESYLSDVRHIEFQFLADSHQKAVHLGERECSLQRRHQKLLEECPSPAITDGVRRKIGRQVAEAVLSVGYENAGTMEFLMNRKGELYFMEINKRLQVEHRPTELVYGLDLVEQQLRLADDQELPLSQGEVERKGAAVNLRIYAEDPSNDFRPSPGKVWRYVEPSGKGIIVDSALYSSYVVPVEYDPLIANIAVHAGTRPEMIRRARRVVDYLRIDGIDTTAPLHREILREPDFTGGRLHTDFVPRFMEKVKLPIRDDLVWAMVRGEAS